MEWLVFGVVVALMFAFDMLAPVAQTFGSALRRTLIYVATSLAYGAFIWVRRGPDDGAAYLTGYVLEASLSLDNIFVISLIFTGLSIPRRYRQRVLTIGILSAMVLRGVFIGAGVALVGAFDWLLIICGLFLIFTGIKSLTSNGEAEIDLEKNRTLAMLRRVLPITRDLRGERFFVRLSSPWKRGSWAATPLFVALVLVEIADVVFAADSVPATLAVTQVPLLVYTSNVFAIMGLRALYQVLEAVVNELEYVGKAVAWVLVFIGAKVTGHYVFDIEVPNLLSLGVVVTLLAGGIVLSLMKRARDGHPQEPRQADGD